MKFVEKHLSTHQLFHAPHRFFFAVILSPFHAAEMHYMRRYHLRFSHAKKLFFFDICLLLCALFLFSASIFWHFYDPTIHDLVSIKVNQKTERITTGEQLSYTLSYFNRSDIAIENTIITFTLPQGFIFQNISPEFEDRFEKEQNSINLGTIAPGAHGTLTLEGILIGTPNQEYESIVKMSYTQTKSTNSEYVISRIFTAARETPLEVSLKSDDFALAVGALSFQITAENQGNTLLENVQIPLPLLDHIRFSDLKTSSGLLNQNEWILEKLPAKTSSTLTGTLLTNFAPEINSFTFETIPLLFANNIKFPQKKISKNITIIHPEIKAEAQIQKTVAQPGEIINIEMTMRNESTLALENIDVIFPIGSEMNKSKLASDKNGIVRGNTFVVNKNFEAGLTKLSPGQSIHFAIPIPLSPHQSGTNIVMEVEPEIQAKIPEIQNGLYTKKIKSNTLKISSDVNLLGALRYFTLEGDQLGLGPLPPKVGKPTRYMSSLSIQNTTGEVRNVRVTATLAPSVSWADKSSVSFGKDLVFDPINKTVTWSSDILPAHTNASINFGIFFTPQLAHIGKTATLIQNIEVSATDTETGLPLKATLLKLDSSLSGDLRAQNIGIFVEP